jgi:phage-related holin
MSKILQEMGLNASSETLHKVLYSLILSPLITFYSPYETLLHPIFALMILDIITGIVASRKEGKAIESKQAWPKLARVGLFLIGLAAAQYAGPLLFQFGVLELQAGKWFCGLYGIYELFSILENLGRLGLPIAKQFADMLKAKLPSDVQKISDEEK